MTAQKAKTPSKRISKAALDERRFETETVALKSLRLIAAPNPEDDLSDEELDRICKDPSPSSDLIRALINCIKAI